MSWIRELLLAAPWSHPQASPALRAVAPVPVDRLTDEGLRVLALGPFEGRLAERIRALKYDQQTALARPLGRQLGALLDEELLSAAPQLVPVPLHPLRLVERGYNQSALVARHAARARGLRVRLNLLARVEYTSSQARLSRDERQHNVKHAFRAAEERDAGARPVLLVDDVVTTGRTLDACADALRLVGKEVLGALCLASKT